MSDPQELDQGNITRETDQIYYENVLRDGYKGLLGAILGTTVAELIVWFGQIDIGSSWMPDIKSANDNVPLIFAAVGLALTLKHLAQIWQAKIQLKQLSIEKDSK